MKGLFLTTCLILSNLCFSQQIDVVKISDLKNRIENSSDTTYIVNFWATWCAPCVKELPHFDSIHKQYANNKIKVLLVSMDFKENLEAKLAPFIKKKSILSEVVLLDELNGNYFIPKISDDWTGSLPATLIINQKKGINTFFEKKLSYSFLEDEVNNALSIK